MSVEPEVGDLVPVEVAQMANGFPLRPGKTQKPLVPEETLGRERLFNWLDARSNRRLIYVVAEAGFGKTTLISDYLRRSRTRTFWYRLDDDDTDGLVFLRYAVAASQSVNPELLRRTHSVLTETLIEPIRLEVVLQTLLTEIDSLGEVPSTFVLDDFHAIESIPSIVQVVERLIEHAPERLRFIIASRRTPSLSVAALKARGGVAELTREDLRFDETETDRLFRDSYRRPLEPDVLHTLQLRTDGWAASLQLVHAAVERRSDEDTRAFIQSLSGAEEHLYEYLASEVVGDLTSELRNFLLSVSVLEEIDVPIASVAALVSDGQSRLLLSQAQRLGLLSRGEGASVAWRMHPLVGDYLAARLETEVGQSGIVEMHRRLAAAREGHSWRLAARHWAAAGNAADVKRVICNSVSTIIGTGDFAAAEELMARFPDPDPNPWYDVIHSRQLSSEGRFDEALELVERAEDITETKMAADQSLAAVVALNRLHLGITMAAGEEFWKPAISQLKESEDPETAAIGRAAELMGDSPRAGNLEDLRNALTEAAAISRGRKHVRYEGISLLNLASTEFALGSSDGAIRAAGEAVRLLRNLGDPDDLAAARVNLARALAFEGKVEKWAALETDVLRDLGKWKEPDAIADLVEIEAMFGDPGRAEWLLGLRLPESSRRLPDAATRVATARVLLVNSAYHEANRLLDTCDTHHWAVAFGISSTSLRLQLQAMANAHDFGLAGSAAEAMAAARNQSAWFWMKCVEWTAALVGPANELAKKLSTCGSSEGGYLTMQAELVLRRLADLDPSSLAVVRSIALQWSARWRWGLRWLLASPQVRLLDRKRGVDLLEIIGNADDVERLRAIASCKKFKLPDAGRVLMKRLAQPAYVDDLGRITITVGDRVVQGADIRRKVLSLLAYLLTRPKYTASRDQIMEALWPEMTPDQAANSLNQTSYFLRQVFEPKAEGDTTAGYVNTHGDLMWLDPDLVVSRSSQCLNILAKIRKDPQPSLVTHLAELYAGHFAADFMYDDWASAYRENLHASFLSQIERSVALDMKIGQCERAIGVAQLALAADPEAEQIELLLLRLYRLTGARAAAEKQYAHYAHVLRDQLGLEPPPFDAI